MLKEIRKIKGINLINKEHQGKSKSINTALKKAKGELIAIIDADSVIEKNSLQELTKTMTYQGFGGATGVVKVKNRDKFLGMWLHIEQLYNSLMRSIFVKMQEPCK